MYPMPVATLYTIFSSKGKILEEVIHREKHCVIPIDINAHWAVLYLDGNRNQAYYLDSYGNKPSDQLVRNVQQKFANWAILCNSVKLQNDSYQCGVWSCCFISVILEFLKSSLKPSIAFGQFIKISLNKNHLCDVRIIIVITSIQYLFHKSVYILELRQVSLLKCWNKINAMLVTWQPMQLATMITSLHSIICQAIFIFIH